MAIFQVNFGGAGERDTFAVLAMKMRAFVRKTLDIPNAHWMPFVREGHSAETVRAWLLEVMAKDTYMRPTFRGGLDAARLHVQTTFGGQIDEFVEDNKSDIAELGFLLGDDSERRGF